MLVVSSAKEAFRADHGGTKVLSGQAGLVEDRVEAAQVAAVHNSGD